MKSISRNPVGSRTARAPHAEEGERTLSDQAYRLLHRDILSGALEPDSKLRLQGLQDRYGLGMSPIREALMLLSREGLVSNEGQRGFRVAPVSADDLRDIVAARIHIETNLLTESILHGDADWGAEISAAFYKLTHEPVPTSLDDVEGIDSWEAAHRRFHRALLAAASSPWLHRINGQLIDHAERYRRLRLARLGFTARTDSIFDEHQALMEATLSRDANRACAVLRDHLNATLSVVDYLDEPLAEPAPALARTAGARTARSTGAPRTRTTTREASPEVKRATPRRTRKSGESAKA
ncbi:GntR family transcriptional regulator [Paraburkholderia susongensis]|uniref:Transcriptional regulator, GntR family n=1 Tax=Paraburkholderia susongensis TaxID=1515439 RepID=A0A1X7LYH3_9BURK|nr:FCD domain-containing protein [Paraburkholderia susongensis]SMG58292.1 transcriptional regulator, GntR family [Paraburkholderia susongensis]